MKNKFYNIVLYSIVDNTGKTLHEDITTRKTAETWIEIFKESGIENCHIHTYEKPYYIKVWKVKVYCHGDTKKTVLFDTNKEKLALTAAAYPFREKVEYAGKYGFFKAQQKIAFPEYEEMRCD